MKKPLLLLLPLFPLSGLAAPAPVAMSDDALLALVKNRAKEMKTVNPEPKPVPSAFAAMCAPPSKEMLAKEAASNPHVNSFARVLVTPPGEPAATGHETTHPAGTVILKEKLVTSGGKPGKDTLPELFTGMLKREAGFNAKGGDWEYFTVSGDAAKVTSRGKLDQCMDCHTNYKSQDFVSRQCVPPRVAKADENGGILLHSKEAMVYGKMLRYEPKPEKNTLGYWVEKDDNASWSLQSPGGTYEVEILQGCGKGSGGAEVEVSTGAQALKFTVEDTGHFQNFIPRVIGRFTLPQAQHTLKVKPLTKPGVAVMDLRSITLRKVKP